MYHIRLTMQTVCSSIPKQFIMLDTINIYNTLGMDWWASSLPPINMKNFNTVDDAKTFIFDRHHNGGANYPYTNNNTRYHYNGFVIEVVGFNKVECIINNGKVVFGSINNNVNKTLTPQEKWKKVMGKY